MNTFGINPSKQLELDERMKKLGIRESDIVEKFVRSSGKGGQNVNKTSTCVYLKHLPSGIEVKVQEERSQAINRFLARRLLTDRLETIALGRKSEERQRIEKLRRQKRKRSRRAKEKILQQKKYVSDKKASRATIKEY